MGLILPKPSWLKLARISSATWLKITNYRKWLVKTQGDGRQAWSGAASKSPGGSVVLDHFMLERKPNSQCCRFSIFQKKTLSHSCPDRVLLWRSAIPIRKSNLFFWRLSVFVANCSCGVVPHRSPNTEYSDLGLHKGHGLPGAAAQAQSYNLGMYHLDSGYQGKLSVSTGEKKYGACSKKLPSAQWTE